MSTEIKNHSQQADVRGDLNPRTLCSVCIASYQRPQMLAELIESLLQQELPPKTDLEIIVVDNDAKQSARPVVDGFTAPRFPIHYHVEERKNISHARNKGVAVAKGAYLLFIDDDETASQKWVSNMLNALQNYQADGVFGRVVSSFHADAPAWAENIFLFNRPVFTTGQQTRWYSTANCIVKADLLRNVGAASFDPRYGVTGGEDTHLFQRLYSAGAKFVYSAEGWVSEFIPPERTEPHWIIKRAYRTGNLYTRRQIEQAEHKLAFRLITFVLTIAKIAASALLLLIFLPAQDKRWHWFLKLAANIGKLTGIFGRRITGY